MATKSASAALTVTAYQVAKTGFIAYADGVLDTVSGSIKANGTSTWGAQTSWSTFNSYITSYQTIKWTAPLLDLGAVQYFTLAIEAEFSGTLSYLIHISDTGSFTGEETEYYIEEGDMNVPGFYGRYIYVTSILSGRELRKIQITANATVKEYIIPNVDSSTLSGTNTNRVIDLPTPVSLIKDIHIQVKAATSYPVNLYVSDTATSEILIPVVKSKSGTSPAFALYGIDNDPRDGVVDITIKALPKQIMYGGNIVVIE